MGRSKNTKSIAFGGKFNRDKPKTIVCCIYCGRDTKRRSGVCPRCSGHGSKNELEALIISEDPNTNYNNTNVEFTRDDEVAADVAGALREQME